MVGEAVLPIAILICGGEGVVARLVVASVVVARVVVARVMVVRMVVVRVSTACFRSALCVGNLPFGDPGWDHTGYCAWRPPGAYAWGPRVGDDRWYSAMSVANPSMRTAPNDRLQVLG